MLIRKTGPAFAATAAALALALTACGGKDDNASADAKSPATEQAKASPSASPSPASGGEMGTGESATGKVDEDPGEVTYEITAQKADVSTEAEAQKAVADPEKAKGLVLAVAHLTYTHKSGPALTDGSDVHDGATVWADGQRGSVLIGATEDEPGCEDPYDVDNWKPGESHTFCETYLIPANSQTVEVHWSEEDGEPYVWKFDAKSA